MTTVLLRVRGKQADVETAILWLSNNPDASLTLTPPKRMDPPLVECQVTLTFQDRRLIDTPGEYRVAISLSPPTPEPQLEDKHEDKL